MAVPMRVRMAVRVRQTMSAVVVRVRVRHVVGGDEMKLVVGVDVRIAFLCTAYMTVVEVHGHGACVSVLTMAARREAETSPGAALLVDHLLFFTLNIPAARTVPRKKPSHAGYN
jgi:hypothetical protein